MDSQISELHSRAESLADAFDQPGNRATARYIDEAIVLVREALEQCGPGHRMRFVSLARLAIHLQTRYDQFGIMEDLEEAIVLAREALSLHPQGHHDRPSSLSSLAIHLGTRYNQLGALQDLEEAIILDREALSLLPQGHPHRSTSLNNLADHLSTRYNKLGASQDLEEAIILDREALSLCPQGHPHRSESLINLASCLGTRYNELGGSQDLDEAIILDREALLLRPQGHPHRSSSLGNLAIHLWTRYNKLGVLQDLEEAIILELEALSLCPQGHRYRSSSLMNLASGLGTRYSDFGALQDLEEAIILDREALSLRPQGHPHRSSSLINLASRLGSRYKKLGASRDLEEAIILDREALSLRPQGHHDRSSSLSSLAVHLWTHYNMLGALQDLEEAIILDREGLSLRPHGHPRRPTSLNNLANRLSTRYNELGALEDLEEAIILDRESLSLRPQGHSRRSSSLNSLAIRLSTRYNELGELQDLEEAIILHREALLLCPQGHPLRSTSLDNLAMRLCTRYNKLGALQDLEEAITLHREALLLCPQGHPNHSSSLNHLTFCLSTRYCHFVSLQGCHGPSPSDLQEIFTLYAQLADISPAVSVDDLHASRAWVFAAEKHSHSSTLLAYETCLRFLVEHLSLLPTLPQHLDVLKKHSSSLAVDAFSACLRNGVPQRAVELLEQGRGVFWNQLTRLRSPLDNVAASCPAGEMLASEFSRLSSLIRKVLDSPGMDQHEELCQHNLAMQGVVAAIRNLPGCSRFLLPSLFSDLRRAASEGPVIIVNASQYGCDALIVFGDHDPVHIPLSITRQYVRHLSSTLRGMTRRPMTMDAPKILGRMLRELWDDVVSPIVLVLQMTWPLQSRIWWCPTAEFCTLPLHAAGPYRKGQQNLAALYISSYTPTLNTLIQARRPCSSKGNVKHFIGIGQANATGQSELFSVGSELANIKQCVDRAAAFVRIEGKEACIPRVAEELGKNAWVHFACHGLADGKKPFKSAFALSDGDFSIERIIRCNLEDAEFAYLSACHTTAGDEESPDEMIHLASAMQFIGFRSVIGTMWAVDDDETNKITSTFYRLMVDASGRLDHTRAAYAINQTIRSANLPVDQRVLYVHIGA